MHAFRKPGTEAHRDWLVDQLVHSLHQTHATPLQPGWLGNVRTMLEAMEGVRAANFGGSSDQADQQLKFLKAPQVNNKVIYDDTHKMHQVKFLAQVSLQGSTSCKRLPWHAEFKAVEKTVAEAFQLEQPFRLVMSDGEDRI